MLELPCFLIVERTIIVSKGPRKGNLMLQEIKMNRGLRKMDLT